MSIPLLSHTRNINIVTDDDVPFTDDSWVEESFMVKGSDLDAVYDIRRFKSNLDHKFTDTSLGGNVSINTYPQFTRYADPRVKGAVLGRNEVKINDLSGNIGMGRYYGEAIDDNSTNVYFEFGVPEFNSIMFYLLSSVDYDKAVIANSGRTPFLYTAGKFFGIGSLVLAFPYIVPGLLLLKYIAKTGMDLLMGSGRFQYYYLKPTMFLYWSTVNSLVTSMATELGIVSPIVKALQEDFSSNKKKKKKLADQKDMIGVPLKIDQTAMATARRIMPDLITAENAINVHAMVTKAQRLKNKYLAVQKEALSKMANESNLDTNTWIRLYKETVDKLVKDITLEDYNDKNHLWSKVRKATEGDPAFSKKDKDKSLSEAFSELVGGLEDKAKAASKAVADKIRNIFEPDELGRIKRDLRQEDKESFISKTIESSKAVFNEGAKFAVFRVEHLGSVSESFSNSTTSVEVLDKVNSMGETYRNITMGIGNAVPGLNNVIKGVTDFAAGALSGLTLGMSDVVASALAGAKVGVPKKYQDSSVSYPTLSFKMHLVSPSAHPLAQLQNLYIPLASLLAGALPLETGPNSSTSPFLCNMFVRGYQRVNLGMITSVSVTRGTSNLPFNKQRRPLALEVTFTVTDFSESISAPIANDLLGTGSVMFDDESGISKYIQALCARDLYATTHVWDRFEIKASKMAMNWSNVFNGGYFGAKIGDMLQQLPGAAMFQDNASVNYSEVY